MAQRRSTLFLYSARAAHLYGALPQRSGGGRTLGPGVSGLCARFGSAELRAVSADQKPDNFIQFRDIVRVTQSDAHVNDHVADFTAKP